MGNQTKSRVRKMSKTQKRPSVKFGGTLSAPARKELWENSALVEAGKKQIGDVPAKFRKFIEAKVRA